MYKHKIFILTFLLMPLLSFGISPEGSDSTLWDQVEQNIISVDSLNFLLDSLLNQSDSLIRAQWDQIDSLNTKRIQNIAFVKEAMPIIRKRYKRTDWVAIRDKYQLMIFPIKKETASVNDKITNAYNRLFINVDD